MGKFKPFHGLCLFMLLLLSVLAFFAPWEIVLVLSILFIVFPIFTYLFVATLENDWRWYE